MRAQSIPSPQLKNEAFEQQTANRFIGKFAALLLACTVGLPAVAQMPVRYELSFPNAQHHEGEIQVTFSGVRQPVLEVVMSRSSPGRYALHEFAKNVQTLKARDGSGKELEVRRASPYQWNIVGHNGTVTVEYTLFADHADGTYAGIDSTHARLNVPAVLAWAHGFEKTPAVLKVNVPPGSGWKVATQLKPNADGTFFAPNLDRLMDGPLEIGPYVENTWKTGDTQFRVALHHKGTAAEAAAYAKAVAAITAEEEGVFGAFPKYDDGLYTFLLDYLPQVAGDGMEHRNSTMITNTRDLSSSATDLLSTVAHEFFHGWNVKRIRPKSLEPFDYERANMSGELWFAEGFTNYYAALVLKRAGLWNNNRFSNYMSNALTTVITAPGREVRSPVEMSRMAPFVDAATSIDPTNTANTFISYYTYGQALGMGLDLAIRSQFPGKSLDDWMRAMWQQHGDVDKAYTLADLRNALAKVTNANFANAMFQQHIEGKEAMDYARLVERVGFVLKPSDKAWLGGRFAFSDTGVQINASLRGGPLYGAGLDRRDRIVQFDGKPIKTQKELDDYLASHKAGDRVKLTVETRDGRKDFDVTLAQAPDLRLESFEQVGRDLTPEVRSLRDAWLSSKAIHPALPVYKYCHLCRRQHPFEYDKCPFDGADLHITPAE